MLQARRDLQQLKPPQQQQQQQQQHYDPQCCKAGAGAEPVAAAAGCACSDGGAAAAERSQSLPITVLYASGGRTAREYAEQLGVALTAAGFGCVTCLDCAAVTEPEQVLLPPPRLQATCQKQGCRAAARVVLLVAATWQGGEPPDAARWFCR
jgi:hypothetical protein